MMIIPDFPVVWDSTMRSAFVACPQQLFWAYLRHLRRPSLSIDLHFGGVIASALEAARKAFYVNGCSLDEAACVGHATIITAWGDDDWDYDALRRNRKYKSLPAAHDALEAYLERWPFDTDDIRPYEIEGELMIEKTFALPIPGVFHPHTGEPILYAARCDMIGDWKETGTIFIDDEKTSSSLGRNWRSNWRLRGQFTGHCWGVRSFGINAKGVIVRGMGILSQEITTDEVIEMRPDWLVDKWLRQLARDVNRAAGLWIEMSNNEAAALRRRHDSGHGTYPPGPCPECEELKDQPASELWTAWDQAFDQACTSYGGCQFLSLCQSEHPERWLSEYEVKEWNPLHRGTDDV